LRRRVLIAWEFGSGFGHLACVLPVLERLRAKGIDPIVAVPNPEAAGALFGARAPRLVPIIPLPSARDTRHPINSFADILLQSGFGRVSTLHAATLAWQELFRRERIEMVLLDYAPVAQLAAWLMDLPMITWTTVFANPPIPLPSIRPWDAVPARSLAASENRLLGCVNAIVRGAGRKPIGSLADWLHAPLRFAIGTEHTNVFGFEPVGYLGPLANLPAPAPPAWPKSGRARVLCYLRWSRGIPNIINALAAPDRELVCVISRAPASWANAARKSPVQVVTSPVGLRPLIRAADVVVSHGSGNLACEALVAGKPQLMFPFDPEKALIARRLGGLEAAIALRPGRSIADAKLALHKLLVQSKFAQAAKSIAAAYRPEDWSASMERLIDSAVG
jgi:hypothetical protein